MTIRKASLADARAIAQVHVASWQAAYQHMLPQDLIDSLSVAKREKTWQRIILNPERNTFIKEQNKHIVAFASSGPCDIAFKGLETTESKINFVMKR